MAELFSIDAFRGYCDTAIRCVEIAEEMRGDPTSGARLRLEDRFEELRVRLLAGNFTAGFRADRESFLKRYPALTDPVKAFEQAAKHFMDSIVTSVEVGTVPTTKEDWSATEHLRSSADELYRALNARDLVGQPVPMRPMKQSRLVAHLDANPAFITLDGRPCPAFEETATLFVAMLIDADGYRVPFPDFLEKHPEFEGANVTLTTNKIPPVIMDYMDREGKGSGLRLNIGRLNAGMQ